MNSPETYEHIQIKRESGITHIEPYLEATLTVACRDAIAYTRNNASQTVIFKTFRKPFYGMVIRKSSAIECNITKLMAIKPTANEADLVKALYGRGLIEQNR